jgi:hypothetical protein
VIAAANLRVDAVTVEVTEAFVGRDVDTILLKGPTLTHWLGLRAARRYVDCDLLVEPAAYARAEEVLERLGFVRYLGEADLGELAKPPAWTWIRDPLYVDLHRTLAGVEAGPEALWQALTPHRERLRLARRDLAVLDRPATAFVLALHASHHGAAVEAPLGDLELGLEGFEREVWEEAARLASAVDATAAFAAGLRLVPAGAALADELDLRGRGSVGLALSTASAPPQAFALEQLAVQPGTRAKARFVAGRLVPSPAWMRANYPFARRGRAGLAVAHGWRLLSAPVRFVPSVRAWRRARREAAA